MDNPSEHDSTEEEEEESSEEESEAVQLDEQRLEELAKRHNLSGHNLNSIIRHTVKQICQTLDTEGANSETVATRVKAIRKRRKGNDGGSMTVSEASGSESAGGGNNSSQPSPSNERKRRDTRYVSERDDADRKASQVASEQVEEEQMSCSSEEEGGQGEKDDEDMTYRAFVSAITNEKGAEVEGVDMLSDDDVEYDYLEDEEEEVKETEEYRTDRAVRISKKEANEVRRLADKTIDALLPPELAPSEPRPPIRPEEPAPLPVPLPSYCAPSPLPPLPPFAPDPLPAPPPPEPTYDENLPGIIAGKRRAAKMHLADEGSGQVILHWRDLTPVQHKRLSEQLSQLVQLTAQLHLLATHHAVVVAGPNRYANVASTTMNMMKEYKDHCSSVCRHPNELPKRRCVFRVPQVGAIDHFISSSDIKTNMIQHNPYAHPSGVATQPLARSHGFQPLPGTTSYPTVQYQWPQPPIPSTYKYALNNNTQSLYPQNPVFPQSRPPMGNVAAPYTEIRPPHGFSSQRPPQFPGYPSIPPIRPPSTVQLVRGQPLQPSAPSLAGVLPKPTVRGHLATLYTRDLQGLTGPRPLAPMPGATVQAPPPVKKPRGKNKKKKSGEDATKKVSDRPAKKGKAQTNETNGNESLQPMESGDGTGSANENPPSQGQTEATNRNESSAGQMDQSNGTQGQEGVGCNGAVKSDEDTKTYATVKLAPAFARPEYTKWVISRPAISYNQAAFRGKSYQEIKRELEAKHFLYGSRHPPLHLDMFTPFFSEVLLPDVLLNIEPEQGWANGMQMYTEMDDRLLVCGLAIVGPGEGPTGLEWVWIHTHCLPLRTEKQIYHRHKNLCSGRNKGDNPVREWRRRYLESPIYREARHWSVNRRLPLLLRWQANLAGHNPPHVISQIPHPDDPALAIKHLAPPENAEIPSSQPDLPVPSAVSRGDRELTASYKERAPGAGMLARRKAGWRGRKNANQPIVPKNGAGSDGSRRLWRLHGEAVDYEEEELPESEEEEELEEDSVSEEELTSSSDEEGEDAVPAVGPSVPDVFCEVEELPDTDEDDPDYMPDDVELESLADDDDDIQIEAQPNEPVQQAASQSGGDVENDVLGDSESDTEPENFPRTQHRYYDHPPPSPSAPIPPPPGPPANHRPPSPYPYPGGGYPMHYPPPGMPAGHPPQPPPNQPYNYYSHSQGMAQPATLPPHAQSVYERQRHASSAGEKENTKKQQRKTAPEIREPGTGPVVVQAWGGDENSRDSHYSQYSMPWPSSNVMSPSDVPQPGPAPNQYYSYPPQPQQAYYGAPPPQHYYQPTGDPTHHFYPQPPPAPQSAYYQYSGTTQHPPPTAPYYAPGYAYPAGPPQPQPYYYDRQYGGWPRPPTPAQGQGVPDMNRERPPPTKHRDQSNQSEVWQSGNEENPPQQAGDSEQRPQYALDESNPYGYRPEPTQPQSYPNHGYGPPPPHNYYPPANYPPTTPQPYYQPYRSAPPPPPPHLPNTYSTHPHAPGPPPLPSQPPVGGPAPPPTQYPYPYYYPGYAPPANYPHPASQHPPLTHAYQAPPAHEEGPPRPGSPAQVEPPQNEVSGKSGNKSQGKASAADQMQQGKRIEPQGKSGMPREKARKS